MNPKPPLPTSTTILKRQRKETAAPPPSSRRLRTTTQLLSVSFFFVAVLLYLCPVLVLSSPGEDVVPSNDKSEEVRRAAKRLIQASLIPSSSESSLLSSLEDDWALLLESLLDSEEVESLMQEATAAADSKEKNGECVVLPEEDNTDDQRENNAAHRQLQGILRAARDPDCLDREFDARSSSHSFPMEEAVRVLEKCRLLVLRNVFSPQMVQRQLPPFRQFIQDVHTGQIPSECTTCTTFGGDYFILQEDRDRFNYMATRALVEQAPDLFANPLLIQILSHPRILGDDMILNHAGTINALPGARKKQYWHFDGEYIVEGDEKDDNPISGHDLPPYAINLFTPLLNLTRQHGPTEFCIGTSWLRGLDVEALLVEEEEDDNDDNLLQSLLEFEWQVQEGGWHSRRPPPNCPPPFSRIPLLQPGDVLLFDYMVTHRGGANTQTKDLRSLLFAMYSRKWYRDTTFDGGGGGIDCDDDDSPDCELEHLTQLTRFAVVDEADES